MDYKVVVVVKLDVIYVFDLVDILDVGNMVEMIVVKTVQ